MFADKPDISEPRGHFHRILIYTVIPIIPKDCRVLMIGKTDVYDYSVLFPEGKFETLDVDLNTRPTIVADIEQYQGEAIYDLVLFFGVYEFMREPKRAIENCEQLVKPDGLLMIGAPRSERNWGKTVYRGHIGDLSRFRYIYGMEVSKSETGYEYSIGVFRNVSALRKPLENETMNG